MRKLLLSFMDSLYLFIIGWAVCIDLYIRGSMELISCKREEKYILSIYLIVPPLHITKVNAFVLLCLFLDQNVLIWFPWHQRIDDIDPFFQVGWQSEVIQTKKQLLSEKNKTFLSLSLSLSLYIYIYYNMQEILFRKEN